MSSRAATGAFGGWALRRSVTLLRVFLLSSAGILFIAVAATWYGSSGSNTAGWSRNAAKNAATIAGENCSPAQRRTGAAILGWLLCVTCL